MVHDINCNGINKTGLMEKRREKKCNIRNSFGDDLCFPLFVRSINSIKRECCGNDK